MEKRYVVAWLNLFDSNLHQEYVAANSKEEAIFNSRQDVVSKESKDCTYEELQDYAFDADGGISVIRIE